MSLTPGQMLKDRYRIVKLLGQGGFGAVYRAWDINLERPCALKENLDTSQAAERQFKREARLLADLSHPNLPHVIDHFVIPGQGQYLVMDFVEGENLQEMLARASGVPGHAKGTRAVAQGMGQALPLPEAMVISWMVQVCEALAYMHAQSPPIIHRDIKPANIKITAAGKAMLVDFGIAKVYDPGMRTTVGARAVTPGFSPIEQYGSGGRTDPRTDVYSLGATLYALLTDCTPVEAPDRNVGATLVAPRALNPGISPQVEGVILRAMEMAPERRFQSAAELGAALTSISTLAGGQRAPINAGREMGARVATTQAAPPAGFTTGPAVVAAPRRLPWGWIGAVGVLSLLVVILLARALAGGNGRGGHDATQTALAGGLPVEPSIVAELPTETWISPASDTPAIAPSDTQAPLPTETPVPAPSETPAALPTTLTDDKGVSMALVPAGEFLMGSPDSDSQVYSNEKPQHKVTLEAFYIDIYEVTNALYAACVQAGACSPPQDSSSYTHSEYYGNATYDDYPVINVDWEQARTYCVWRGARLPTEAEWEKAARGGLEGRLYPWGDEAPDCTRANFGVTSGCEGDTSKVGSYPPNSYDLYDMAGNVWEWVMDWYSEYYASSPSMNPLGTDSGQSRVLRGGSWDDDAGGVRSAARGRYDPGSGGSSIGFRCARSP